MSSEVPLPAGVLVVDGGPLELRVSIDEATRAVVMIGHWRELACDRPEARIKELEDGAARGLC